MRTILRILKFALGDKILREPGIPGIVTEGHWLRRQVSNAVIKAKAQSEYRIHEHPLVAYYRNK